MDEVTKLALAYFRPSRNYFWRWAESGKVIEWQNGTTICYRGELTTILRNLVHHGLPQMGSLLLVLAACHDDWKRSGGVDTLQGLLKFLKSKQADLDTNELERCILLAASFLDMINELPKELRSGDQKSHLLYEIFKDSVLQIPTDKALRVFEDFWGHNLDEAIFKQGPYISGQQLHTDLARLILALKEYKNKNNLELKLRTGVYQAPQPANVEIPETLSLLEELAQDTNTAGIARLTQRLIAALNIPMHTQGASDQPFGGVSDITNRGNFDRLLLSELAYDDDVLVARLVNNEALYLRREEPPDQVDRQRVILVDSTIKMWGVPRLFAISAALACAQTTRAHLSISAYSLGKTDFNELDLASKKGVMGALERLDAGLDCSQAVVSFLANQPTDHQTEHVLICDEQLTRSLAFQLAIEQINSSLNFLITVNRNGELHFYEYRKEHRKLLSTTKFDLEELLFGTESPTKRVQSRISENQGLPAFLSCEPSPLYFPTSGMRISGTKTFQDPILGVVGINEVQRILYWPKKGTGTGAIELLIHIEKGEYFFGSNSIDRMYIMVKNFLAKNDEESLLKLYRINTKDGTVEMTDFYQEIGIVHQIVFHSNHYYLRMNDKAIIIDCRQGKVTNRTRFQDVISVFYNANYKSKPNFGQIKAHINNGYSTLQRVKNIYVTSSGELHLDNYYIWQLNNGFVELLDNYKDAEKKGFSRETPQRVGELNTYVANPNIKFAKTVWTDGSEAVVDSRGLLHLRSSDTNIPQITILLVIGKGTACWASDGTISGPYYFTGVDPARTMPARQFYKHYIQRFIDRLL